MKKNLLYGLILTALLGVAWWLTQQDDRSTLKREEADFHLDDTASIDKFFIADKSGRSVVIERISESQWLVNKKHLARPDAIEFVLSTFLRVEVKSPVPRAAIENVKKQIGTIGKKVEVYSAGKKLLVFYVGHPTIDSRGTYVLRENAALPYIVHLPGWEGFITPRFFTDEEEWRERIMVRLNPDSIRSIATEFTDKPEESFVLTKGSGLQFELRNGAGQKANIDTAAVRQLFGGFTRLPVESYDNYGVMKDSVVNMLPPFLKVTVQEFNGNSHTFNAYPKSQLNQLDVVLLGVLPDLDRDYFFYEERNDFGYVQRRAIPWLYFTYLDLKAKD
jgi:hypothetical protein